jgi:hypothetical protein
LKYPCPKCEKPLALGPKAQSGKQRWVCRGGAGDRAYCYSTTRPEGKTARKQDGSPQRSKKIPLFKRALKGVTRFLVTAAQNGTPAHKGFVDSLESAANHLNAEIIAIPLMYKNTDSKYPASQANEPVWADEVQAYLCNQRKKLNPNLILMGDVKTLPTATSPLTGFEAMSHGESAIYGHTKLQLRSIPTPQSSMPKLLTTTGACTLPNMTDSRAGKLGDFHTTAGAALVEVQGKAFHLRQINASKTTGEFQDLTMLYTPSGVRKDQGVEALIMGDTHTDFLDPLVWKATQDMIRTLKPKLLVFHDLCDGHAINHHTRGNWVNALAKIRAGRSDARGETERAILFAQQAADDFDVDVIVVPSNHNDFLMEWIKNTDPRHSPANLRFWCETAMAVDDSTRMGPGGAEAVDPFVYWGRKLVGKNSRVKFLDRDESYVVAGIELGMHGDVGPNGARGSINNLRRIGVKSVIGHSHTPGISEGCYQVGTSTPLQLEYTRGCSSWLNTNCVIYGNGKRSLLNIIDGRWRL